MARRLMVVAAMALLTAPLGMGPAEAGAACPTGFEVARGNRVIMKQDCFVATVLHVDPGDRVSFVNLDSHGHTVGGAAGTFGDAHRDVAPGASVEFRFSEEGVFPYFCTYHSGMTGAVVVGDGVGSEKLTVAATEVAATRVADRADGSRATEGSSGLVTAAWASGAAGLGLAGGLLLRRRRA